MIGGTLATLLLLAAASTAQMQEPAVQDYYVRNDTGRAFSCGFQQPPNRKVFRFLLRRGTDHARAFPPGRRWVLLCDTMLPIQRYRLHPGQRYALVEGPRGRVILRRID